MPQQNRKTVPDMDDFHPLYLRLSVTERCNLRCAYCRPQTGEKGMMRGSTLSDAEILGLLDLVGSALPIDKLRITGGDPLLRPRLPVLVKKIRRRFPSTLLVATTNGLLLGRQAEELRSAGLDSLNVSLDTLDPRVFARLCGIDGLQSVLQGLKSARRAGFGKIRINTVLLRSANGGTLHDLFRFAGNEDFELRLIELMPIGVAAEIFDQEFFSAGEALEMLSLRFGVPRSLGLSGTAERYLFPNGQVLGLIRTQSAPFCASCNRLRLDSRGWLYPCLHDYEGIDLFALWRSGRPDEAISEIRRAHGTPGDKRPIKDWTSRPMIRIGG